MLTHIVISAQARCNLLEVLGENSITKVLGACTTSQV